MQGITSSEICQGAEVDVPAHAQAQLNGRMIVELKEMLRKRQQQVKGTKTDLIERLTPVLLREAAVADYMAHLTSVFPLHISEDWKSTKAAVKPEESKMSKQTNCCPIARQPLSNQEIVLH